MIIDAANGVIYFSWKNGDFAFWRHALGDQVFQEDSKCRDGWRQLDNASSIYEMVSLWANTHFQDGMEIEEFLEKLNP